MSTNFPTNYDVFTYELDGSVIRHYEWINLQDAARALEIKIGKHNSTDGTSLDYKIKSFFKKDRTLWVYEDTESIPVGWSLVSVTDRLLGVRGGATYLTAGATAGDWTITGLTHSHGIGTYYGHLYHTHHNYYNYYPPGTSGLIWHPQYQAFFLPEYAGSPSQPVAGTSASSNYASGAWRPAATVGIIIRMS